MSSSSEWDCDSVGSSSDSSVDSDQFNARLSPSWSKYRDLILSRGYRLDTVRDVREYYLRYRVDAGTCIVDHFGYLRAHLTSDDSALCKDPGLVWRDPILYVTII